MLTLYTGYEFGNSIEALVDVEEAGGQELSQALGVAGLPNLDVVRNPTLSQSPYLAFAMFTPRFLSAGRGLRPYPASAFTSNSKNGPVPSWRAGLFIGIQLDFENGRSTPLHEDKDDSRVPEAAKRQPANLLRRGKQSSSSE